MSLFQVREWWSTLAGFEEFHTTGSLAVTKLDPSTSYNGMKRGVSVYVRGNVFERIVLCIISVNVMLNIKILKSKMSIYCMKMMFSDESLLSIKNMLERLLLQ